MDQETGLYNYGARYYDPSLSLWLGVDPLADMMPGFSPYNYVFNNPINLTDPTGMSSIDPDPTDPDPVIDGGAYVEPTITAKRGPTIGAEPSGIAPLDMPSVVNSNRGGTQYLTNNEMYSSVSGTNSQVEFNMFRGNYGMEHAHGVFQHGIKQAISNGYQPFYAGLAIISAIETGGAAYSIYRAYHSTHTIFRVVGAREAVDAMRYGFRSPPISSRISAYEGKLFWSKMDDALWFQKWSGSSNSILKVRVKNSFIYENGTDVGHLFYYVERSRMRLFNSKITSIK